MQHPFLLGLVDGAIIGVAACYGLAARLMFRNHARWRVMRRNWHAMNQELDRLSGELEALREATPR